MIVVKKHNYEDKAVLALADKNILGKKFSENDLQLDLKSDFYKGEEKNKEEIKEMIKYCDILNIVGKESIKFCKENNLIDKRNVIYIKGIPHAQVLLLKE